MRAVATLVSLALLTGSAAASPHRKSPDTAKLLSGLGAGASAGLVLGSFLATDPHNPYNKPLFYAGVGTSVVSPSFGEWYAGQYLTYGMAVRAAAVGIAILGVTRTQPNQCVSSTPDFSCTTIEGKGIALLGVALIAYVGGAFYDVLDAPDAVDAYNHRLRMQLTPGPMPSTLGPPGGGLWLSGSF